MPSTKRRHPPVLAPGPLRERGEPASNSFLIKKMLRGGSLVIAYPALLGLRERSPDVTMSLLTTRSTAPFARTLGVFARIDKVDDSSLPRRIATTLASLWRNFHADTVVDLEVSSRLTTVLSSLPCARNLVWFHLDIVFWRKQVHTYTVFFNRCTEFWGIHSAVLHYARLLGLRCVSYRVPTDLATRFRPITGLEETVRYGKVPCSPCIHSAGRLPCHRNNMCIQSLFGEPKDYGTASWIV